ncbi:Uncharacterised protein [Neisseria animalis]|nr:Uncharacterised protein [Neisseria animalis]
MIQRCFALPYYLYCLQLRCLVSFLFYSTIKYTPKHDYSLIHWGASYQADLFTV